MKRLILILAGYFASVTNASDDSPDELVEMAGVKGGLIVQVGCGDGTLTAALRMSNRFVVHALDVDAAKVARASLGGLVVGLAWALGASAASDA